MDSNSSQGMEARQKELLAAAAECAANAFCQFSQQRMGVCVRGTDGKIYRGCTFDSAAFPCSICATHVAVAQAATKGKALVSECAVVVAAGTLNETDHPLKGCCLEWLCQYAHQEEVLIHSAVMPGADDEHRTLVSGKVAMHKLSELLPMGKRLPLPFPSPRQPLYMDSIRNEDGEEPDEVIKELVKAAAKAAEWSCCWKSGVSVGCAILTEDGIVTGANAETIPLGIGCCAEQNAIACAVALGRKKFLKAAVICATMPTTPCHPCGRCLQLFMQAQERTRAAVNCSGEIDQDRFGARRPELLLVMPWQQTSEQGGTWTLKTRRLDEMGASDRFML